MESNLNLNNNNTITQTDSQSISSPKTPVYNPTSFSEGPQPIHLIYYNQAEKKFRVSEEAKQFLSTIKERVGVIAVAGKYRTGKSFLLNRVIINKHNQGFGVGPTINPCTKGLWLWSQLLETEYQGEKLKVLLIDSEGIGAFDEDENHDTKIFLLALLLSSYFVYNSMGTIDENAINNLSLIINLSKELQIKSDVIGDCDPDEIAKYFPSFLWVVRDFSLKLLDTYGTAITSKEYFENALQQQKGSSDNVETKNRIRRLISHFFKDRDCFTMVRPVEQEKELQSLQNLPDESLRVEFLQQMQILRQKIMKRVKPKTLNSKFLNGEMLLELCYSYTDAINTGTLPNIQNAWSYVCQNECQRAISESIQMYEQGMRIELEEAKKECKEQMLAVSHRVLREKSVAGFRDKAVGSEFVGEFEIQLRDGISKKRKDIKNEFLRYCKQKAQESVQEEVQQLKKQLSQESDQFPSFQQYQEELDNIKQRFNEKAPDFSQKSEILLEILQQLTLKYADFKDIQQKQSQNGIERKLKEKIESLEQTRIVMKNEFNAERRQLEQKIFESEASTNAAIRNEKVLEERLKYLQEEREKSEKNLLEKGKAKIAEKEERIKELESKSKSLESFLKNKEDENYRKVTEFEKLNALIEQKLQLTEKELSEYKVKYTQKDQDYKEVNKELYQGRKELQTLTNDLHKLEQEKVDTISQLKQEYELQIQDLQSRVNSCSGNPQVSDDHEKKWIMERQSMQQQMQKLFDHIESQKKFQESLVLAINNSNQQKSSSSPSADPSKKQSQAVQQSSSDTLKMKQKNKELLTTNQNLSQQIVQMQVKQSNLEKTIVNLKQFKYFIHYSLAIQCKYCTKLFPKNQYGSHLQACIRENERQSTLFAQQYMVSQPLELAIINCLKGEGNKDYKYEIQVEKNSQTWMIKRSVNDFKQLFIELSGQFSNYTLPQISDEFLANKFDDFFFQDFKLQLQAQLNDLTKLPLIRETASFKQFLEIQEHYVEEEGGSFEEYQTNNSGSQKRQYQSMGGANFGLGFNGSFINRSSMVVANPFSSQTNSTAVTTSNTTTTTANTGKIMNINSNISNYGDGRKSAVVTNMYSDANKKAQGYFQQNSNQYIQELIEDEDHSSFTSKDRASNLVDLADQMSNRQSIFSSRNTLEFNKKGDNNQGIVVETNNVFHSKTNSPFQQNKEVNIRSSDRYQPKTYQEYGGSSQLGEDDQFEDSFSQDLGDSSSNRKITFLEDESSSLQNSIKFNNKKSQQLYDENSPPSQDIAKTNLIKQFDAESSNNTFQISQQQQKRHNRYDDSQVQIDISEESINIVRHV